MAACPNCGEQNAERARFCSNCGTSLATSGEAPREVRKTVTVVFTDVTGSTRLGDKLDPESMRRVMNRFFEEMRAVLERHGGTVEKFIGDAVMAVFGVPTLHEDDALRAIRAAHEMREALAALNEELQRDRGISLLTRTGVNTGEVVTGDRAGEQRLVTGDAVNVAARLEQAAQPSEVLIGESTWRLVRDAAQAEEIPPLSVKGKDEPIGAYRLLDVRADVAGVGRHLDSPMVGRDRQLAQLGQAFDAAVADRACHLFTVLGSAGVGKSRLVLEFLASLPSEARVLRGRCLPYGEGITYWPIREIISAAAGVHDDDSLDEVRRKLRSLVGEVEDEEAIAERVAQVFALADASAPGEEISWAVRHLLETLAQDRPLVAVVDDIHWAEPTLLDLIEHVVDLTRDAPILLLCIARPELLDARPGWGGGKLNATSILLEPLPEADTELLIENLLGQAALDESARVSIAEAAEGNPLFVEEMLSMLIDEGLLARSNGHWVPTADLTKMKVPPTIQALLAARLDLLRGEERQVIERASVVGKVFYRNAVTELTPEPVRPRVPGHLTTLVRRELIRPERSEAFARDEGYRFRHILIRDAAYEGISKETRAELHEAFADWLERTVGARIIEYEEILAFHLEQAYRFRAELGPVDENARRLGERAAALLASSGRRAFARTDLSACINLLGRAVAIPSLNETGRIELLVDMALALTDAGDYSRVESVVSEAIQAAETANDARLTAHGVLVRLRALLFTDPEGRTDETRREAELAIAIFEEHGDDQGLARAWNALAWAHWMQLRTAARQEALERAIEHARRAGDRGEELESIYYLSSPIVRGPMRVSEGLLRLERIREEGGSSRKVECAVLWGTAFLQAMRGRFEDAREAAARCVAIAEELGMKPQAAGSASELLGYLEMLAGDPVAAEREVRKAYEAMDRMGEKGLLSTIAADLALILCHLGRFQEAESFIQVSRESAASDDVASQVNWRAAMAEVLASRGRGDEAVELAREAVELIGRTDVLTQHAETLMHLVDVLRTVHRTDEARDALEQALALYERKENVVGAERARRMLVELAVSGEAG